VAIEKRIHAWHRSSEESRRREEIPVGDWKTFSSGLQSRCVDRLGAETAFDRGKEKLGRISKQGNRHLRWLLVAGAMAVIRYARQHGTSGPGSLA
jgi:transposase